MCRRFKSHDRRFISKDIKKQSGVRFRIPPLPQFPIPNTERLEKAGRKIEPGVPLPTFIKTVYQHLPRFQRRFKNKIDYRDVADEIYSRRLDHHHYWNADVSSRRTRLSYGQSKDPHTEFGQPHLRGGRLHMLWKNLFMADWERSQEKGGMLGFERNLDPIEQPSTIQNRHLEVEGLSILRARKARLLSRTPDPFSVSPSNNTHRIKTHSKANN